MTLGELANLGEFVGGVAVIVSILYLAVQIRQNSRAVRATAYRSFYDSGAQILTAIAQGPPPAETFTKGLPDMQALSPAEAFQFITLLTVLLQAFQTSFFQHQDGLMPDRQWRQQRAVARWWLSHPGVQATLQVIGPSLDSRFLEEIKPRTARLSSAVPAA